MGVPSKCDGAPMRFFWRGIDAIETIDAIDAIDAIDTIGAIGRMGDFFGVPQPTEAHCSPFAVSKLRFRLRLRLHGVAHNTPSPMASLRSALSLPVGGHLCVGVF